MSSLTSGIGHQKRNQTRYSTFVDNENYDTATGNGSNKASNNTFTPPPVGNLTSSPYTQRVSTSSLHSTYNLPPLPDVTTPTDIEKSKNGAATSSHRSRIGAALIRLGTACCPCLSPGRIVTSTPTGGSSDWLWAFGRRLLLAVSFSRSRTEDTRLLQRTASEEEILSRRPRFTKKTGGSFEKNKNEADVAKALRKNEGDDGSPTESKYSRSGSNATGIASPDMCDEDEEDDSLCSLKSTSKSSEVGGRKVLGGKSSTDGSQGVIPKDPGRKRRSRRDQAKIAKAVGKGKPGPGGVVSARFRPPHEMQRTSSASSVINRATEKHVPARTSTYSMKRNYCFLKCASVIRSFFIISEVFAHQSYTFVIDIRIVQYY